MSPIGFIEMSCERRNGLFAISVTQVLQQADLLVTLLCADIIPFRGIEIWVKGEAFDNFRIMSGCFVFKSYVHLGMSSVRHAHLGMLPIPH
jgi:O-antigen ligase